MQHTSPSSQPTHKALSSLTPRDPPAVSTACPLAEKEHNTFDAPEFPERPNLAKIFIKGMPKRRKDAPLNGGVNHPWLHRTFNRHGQVEFLQDLTFIIPPLISSLLILSSF